MTMLMIEIRRKFAEEQFEFSKNAVDSDGVATLLKGNVMTIQVPVYKYPDNYSDSAA